MDEVRQQEAIVELRPPANELRAIGSLPNTGDNGADQKLLRQAHARIGRHLEAAELDQPEPARAAVGRVELIDAELRPMRVAADVDENVAKDAVDQPGRAPPLFRNQVAGQLQLVEAVVARFIDARGLACRSDRQAGKKIRERRMVVPVRDQAAQQIRPAQDRTIRRRRAAENDVVAPAGADMPAIEHELLGAESGVASLVVQRFDVVDEIGPAGRGLDVHLDDARVRRDLERLDPGIEGGGVPFERDGHQQGFRGRLDQSDEFQVIVGSPQGRQKHVELTAARLDAERVAHDGVRTARLIRMTIAADANADRRLSSPRLRQVATFFPRVLLDDRGTFRCGSPGERIERQPVAHRRVAGNQEQMLAAQRPAAAHPDIARIAPFTAQWQDVAHDSIQALLEQARQAGALLGALEPAFQRIDVGRQQRRARRARSCGSATCESSGSTLLGSRRSRQR